MTEIMHPRPSPIVAALYTLRDLDADVIIVHGPAGCCFRAARLLEEDGVRVVTTALLENDIIFGAKNKLINTIKKIKEMFNPDLIGIVGTCSTMIIGEEIQSAVDEANLNIKTVIVEVHACMGDNTLGAIKTLESAYNNGLVTLDEFKRQERMLKRATEIEKEFGMAKKEYIRPSLGDDKAFLAKIIFENIKSKKNIVIVLNSKKETTFLFADILLAINEINQNYNCSILNIANLNPEIGLPRIRKDASNILKDLKNNGVKINHITGGLDEYPICGEKAAKIIEENNNFDLKILLGLPHAIPLKNRKNCIAITNGPREVEPLREMGYKNVGVELTSHSDVMGTNKIVTSELGAELRKIAGVK
ncbi:MAG: Ni-sirohydrochlorin a,c-diamide reductive cyclase catalytic subunit [Candidatus Hodarchaeota archaeon]